MVDKGMTGVREPFEEAGCKARLSLAKMGRGDQVRFRGSRVGRGDEVRLRESQRLCVMVDMDMMTN